MKCLKNPSDLVLWGNYDLPSAANLVLTFEKCDPQKSEVECKSDEEITEWLEFKYLVGIWNSKNFVQHRFDDDRIQSTSNVFWYPISASSRLEYLIKISRNTMQLNDS